MKLAIVFIIGLFGVTFCVAAISVAVQIITDTVKRIIEWFENL